MPGKQTIYAPFANLEWIRAITADGNAIAHPIKGWFIASEGPSHGFYSAPLFRDNFGGPLIITPDLLLRALPGKESVARKLLLARFGAKVEMDFGGMKRSYRVRNAAQSGLAVLHISNELAQCGLFEYCEPDTIFTGTSCLVPNDPLFPNTWSLYNANQRFDLKGPEAWDIALGNPAVITVVIDTGIQMDHPDLNVASGADFTTDAGSGGPINEFDNHGTAVAGCISMRVNNGLGGTGIAGGTRSASARTFISINYEGNWNSQASWTVDALAWAESIGARVTNNSNVYGFTSSAINSKYASSLANNVLHFAAAGNSGANSISYPASLNTVNSVSAIDPYGTITSWSQRGGGLDFCAPGAYIITADRVGSDGYSNDGYAGLNGTSFASPYVAGVAAMVLSVNPSLTAAQVLTKMQTTVRDRGNAGWDSTYGWGLPQTDAAMLNIDAPFTLTSVSASEGEFLSGALSDLSSQNGQFYKILSDGATLSGTVSVGCQGSVARMRRFTVSVVPAAGRSSLAAQVLAQKDDGSWRVLFGGSVQPIPSPISGFTETDVEDLIRADRTATLLIRFTPINDEDPAQDGWELGVDHFSVLGRS